MTLFYILISTLAVSLISFIGVVTLVLKKKSIDKMFLVMVAFSAGSLIGGSFLHLIPEALKKRPESVSAIFLWIIIGFCAFFILEKFIHWHHHHAMDHPEAKPFSYLILFSDALHNFIDGLVISASFLVAVPAGITATVAVAMHEIPQELGDFGVLVYGGIKTRKALFLNFISAFFAVLGGVLGFFFFEKAEHFALYLLPFAAGNFIYLASSDLIPEIKSQKDAKSSLFSFLIFISGVALMLFL